MTHTSITRSRAKAALNPNHCIKRKVVTRKRQGKLKWFIKYVETNNEGDLVQVTRRVHIPDKTVSDDTAEEVKIIKPKVMDNDDDIASECSSSDASW